MSQATSPLDSLHIASPCTASWDAMAGDERKRFCGQCSLTVYNLSEMNRAQAEALIIRAEGRLCVRFYRRADGTVISQDCPVGLRAVRRRLALLAGTLATALIALGTWASMLRRSSGGMQPQQSVALTSLPWREVEPFKTWIEWADPTPPVRVTPPWGSHVVMGGIGVMPPSSGRP